MDAVDASESSEYFHRRIVRSRPAEATCDGDMYFAALIEDVCPPLPADGDVTRTSEDMLHTLKRPS